MSIKPPAQFKKKESRWVIKVPDGSTIYVKQDQKVEKGEVILSIEQKEVKIFDASIILSKYSGEKIEELEKTMVGRMVEEGELILSGGGMFPKKIFSPCKGTILAIDEFGNIKFEISLTEKREIRAPVRAMVVKIEKDKIFLGFDAYEFLGKGLVEGKTWGNFGGRVEKLAELNYKLKGNVVFTDKLSYVLVIKAGVIGVAGIVTKIEGNNIGVEQIESTIPILTLDEKNWENLTRLKLTTDDRILLNSKKGKLVIV